MIKNVVFDIGNVLLSFDPRSYLVKKFDDEFKAHKVFDIIFKSNEWLMLDRGTISEKEAISILSKRHEEFSEEIKSSFDGWYDLLIPMEETIEVLQKLKENKINIYYLSNFHHLAFEYVTEKNKFFNLFDGGIVSYKEKLLKPEKEIYLKLIDKYNLNPEETLFIDDTEINLKGALAVGMNTVHFKDPQGLVEKLSIHKIKIS